MTATVTYYVVKPFKWDGGLAMAGDPIEKPNRQAAIAAARMLGDRKGHGAIAFSRTGDPATGDWEPAVVIQTFGEVPDDAADD